MLKNILESGHYPDGDLVLEILNKNKNGFVIHSNDDEMTERVVEVKTLLQMADGSVEKYIKVYNDNQLQAVIEFVNEEEGYKILKERK